MSEAAEELMQEPVEEQATEEVQETDSESATDSPEEGEQNTQEATEPAEPAYTEGVQKAIDRQHRKFREEQRRANDLEKRLKELEAKTPATAGEVVIPPPPDPWDDNYQDKIRQRDEALLRKAQADAQKAQQQTLKAEQERERQRLEYEKAQALQNQFAQNSKKLGLDEDQLTEAQNKVIEYGVTPEIANTLLEDEEGPLLVQYLAANPIDLYDIVEANPVKAGLLIAKAKSKASALKPKPSAAPKPPTRVEGRSSPSSQRGLKGDVFF